MLNREPSVNVTWRGSWAGRREFRASTIVMSTSFNLSLPHILFFPFLWKYSSLTMLVSGAQQSDSVIHMYTNIYILFLYSPPLSVTKDIEYSSLYYTVGPCWLSILFIYFFLRKLYWDQYFSFKITVKMESLLECSNCDFFKYFIRKIFKHIIWKDFTLSVPVLIT